MYFGIALMLTGEFDLDERFAVGSNNKNAFIPQYFLMIHFVFKIISNSIRTRNLEPL